ncbi:MAG TPA: DUF4386 domain-containing protein [Puia sp.]|jgi:hypothetical protein|nr:DUF4386 domain-containing protein [Puia sp.]
MTISAINKAQRKAAIVAGFAYLITFATVVYVNFGIHDRLIIGNNAAETARNILAHERLFRIGIVGDLIYCTGVVVLLTALYVILKPVNWGLALLAALWRLIWVLMWLVMTLNLFDALRFLSDADFLRAFEADRLQALVMLHLGTRFDYYYVGLLFGSLASTVCGYLWFRSRYIPRALAVFGIISSAFCVACTLVFYIFPNFDKIVNLWWFDTPMGIFDIVLSFWLLFKGLRPSEIVAST